MAHPDPLNPLALHGELLLGITDPASDLAQARLAALATMERAVAQAQMAFVVMRWAAMTPGMVEAVREASQGMASAIGHFEAYRSLCNQTVALATEHARARARGEVQ